MHDFLRWLRQHEGDHEPELGPVTSADVVDEIPDDVQGGYTAAEGDS